MRFNQECVFVPVSSRPGPIQAFIPAPQSAVSGRFQIYGPHGTPLPAGYVQGVANVPHYPPPPYVCSNGSLQPPYASPPDDRSSHLLPPLIGYGSHSRSSFGGRYSGDDYHHYSSQPPSPSSHLHPPGHFSLPSIKDSSTNPSSNYGQGPLPPMTGSYYQRRDSSDSHRAEHSSVSPQPALGSWSPPHDPGQLHLPPHAARSAADGDMLNRLNYRTGI
jgi:hypothetical protein